MKPRSFSGAATIVAILVLFSSVAPRAEAQRRHTVTRHTAQSTLSGVVLDSASSEPVPDVDVTIQNLMTKTDENGEFEFEALAAGTWEITVDRWGYQGITREIEIVSGQNSADFTLELLPFIVVTRTDDSTERFSVDSVEYGYVVPFTGTFASKTLKVCTGNPDEPINLEAGDIAEVRGPATRVETPCCPKFQGEQVTIQRRDGSTFDAVVLDSCPPYDIYFIGRSLDRGLVVYSRLSETSLIEYPQ